MPEQTLTPTPVTSASPVPDGAAPGSEAASASSQVFTPVPTETAAQPTPQIVTAPIPEVSVQEPVSAPVDVAQEPVVAASPVPASETPVEQVSPPSVPASAPTSAQRLSLWDKFMGKKPKSEVEQAGPAATKDLQQFKKEVSTADAEKIYAEGLASVKDLIAPSSFEINFNTITVSGRYARSFFVYAYPRFLDANWLSPVVNFDVSMEIAQFIYPVPSGEILTTLKRKVAQMQSSLRIDAEKHRVRDPMLEAALQDAEALRDALVRGEEKFFHLGLYFTLYAEDPKKLDDTAKQLETLLAARMVLVKRADIQNEHAFNATLPQGTDELEVLRNMSTGPLSTAFPFVSSDLTSDQGILYGLNRHNDGLVIFDRFKLPNANSVVFATSGAGKSYAVKLEILRQLMTGTDVIIIDPENEYESLATSVDGTYIRMSLASSQTINPFDLPKGFADGDETGTDMLRSNIVTLTGLMKVMLGDMTPEEQSLIDRALIDTYAVRGITMETEDPTTMMPPTMDDFYSVLSTMRGAESLTSRLSRFTSGTFGGLFNKLTNVNLNAGLVVFCIRDLEDELRPIATYILLNFIWSRVRSELKRRILVVDEAWSMMQHEDAARFLFGLVKRARKYYLGVTTITQDVDDFMRSEYGRPIVTNASMQLLLKQSPSSLPVLKEVFNLTEGEKYLLLNSGVGQGLFFADSKHVAIQVIASYSENQLVTTNPEERIKMRAAS